MKILCTILARGGSKGFPGKNIKLLCGKPLISHTISQASGSNLFDTIAVSSDSEEILKIASAENIKYLIKRPYELASDTAPKLPAIRHCVEQAEVLGKTKFDIVVDLDPTSPLRSVQDIKSCLELLVDSNSSNVITGCPARKSPYFNMVELDDTMIARLSKTAEYGVFRRQDAPKVFDMNASIYVWKRDALFDNDSIWNPDTRLHVMPQERSIDIDSEIDFELVNLFLKKRGGMI